MSVDAAIDRVEAMLALPGTPERECRLREALSVLLDLQCSNPYSDELEYDSDMSRHEWRDAQLEHARMRAKWKIDNA